LGFLNGLFFPYGFKEYIGLLYITHSYLSQKLNRIYYIGYLFTFCLIILTIKIMRKNMSIDKKFSCFFLTYLFFGIYSFGKSLAIIMLPFISLMIISQNKRRMLIGVVSIISISFIYFIRLFIYQNEVFEQIEVLICFLLLIFTLIKIKIKK